MGKKIGIVPAYVRGAATESNMQDFYKLGNNYIKRVAEAGCIPLGMAPVNRWLPEEAMELCDGFIVQGGAAFYPYHFQVIHHAITRGKRYLGICLGEQLIYVYLELRRRVEAEGYEGDLPHAIWAYRKAQPRPFSVLVKAHGHRSPFLPRGREEETKHEIRVVPGTLLHRVLGKDTVRISTFHDLQIPSDQKLVTVNAWSAKGDGVVEGAEYGENILGVQGHPEIDEALPQLFRFLSEE